MKIRSFFSSRSDEIAKNGIDGKRMKKMARIVFLSPVNRNRGMIFPYNIGEMILCRVIRRFF
jgi:hypothetical protein